MPKDLYSTDEAAAIAGVKPATLLYWVRTELIVPSVNCASGSGTRHIFSFEDLVQLRFVRQLRMGKWSLQKIRIAVKTLRDIMDHPNPLQHAVVFGDRRTILALAKTPTGQRIVIDTLSPGAPQVMEIVLETLMSETREVVEQRAPSKELSVNELTGSFL